jgi:hypothetical protein
MMHILQVKELFVKLNMSLKNISRGLVNHVVDSTAIVTAINPVMSIVEKTVNGMSNDISINARILGTAITYGGLGSVYSKGRDLSRKLFGITASSTEKVKGVHDHLFSLAYSTVITPPFYYAAGSRDLKEIAIGTVTTMGIALAMGGAMGYSIDAFRDLTGIEESERLPDLVKNQNSYVKKGLAALLTMGSVGTMAAIYSLTR